MLLQAEFYGLLTLGAAVAALGVLLFFVSRRQPPAPVQEAVRYTPGEQEILNRLGDIRERLEKMIPPYGRVGYIPSTLEELKELLGFSYVKLGDKELGEKNEFVKRFEDLDVDFLQASIGDSYVYVVRRGSKRLVAVGNQHLDYLTIRFLNEFLDYT
ncbi:MAG: hypothetical protein ABWK05_07990 [Pyrobaculum sp.]